MKDKFEHEKHNRRERVYKYPRINLWSGSIDAAARLQKRREKEELEKKCLALYRDFFRNPKNESFVEFPLSSKKFDVLPEALLSELKIGSKVFKKIDYGSAEYRNFMTPRELLFYDASNEEMYEKYRADIELIREQEEIARRTAMIDALQRNRFQS